MTQARLKAVLAAGLQAREIVPASATDAKFAQAAREVLLKHRAAQGFRDPPPKGGLIESCCTAKEDKASCHEVPTGAAEHSKCCDSSKQEGPEFEALQQRVEQLEMLVRFLLSRPYMAPIAGQIAATGGVIYPSAEVERPISRR